MIKHALEAAEMEHRLIQAQKMEALGTLAGGIAHDFNNIIMAATGYLDIARIEVNEPESVQECLSEVHKALSKASDLVQQILTFARSAETKITPVKLQYVIRDVLNFLRRTIPEDIDVRIDLDKLPTCFD